MTESEKPTGQKISLVKWWNNFLSGAGKDNGSAQQIARQRIADISEQKEMPPAVIEHEQNARADGKSWVQTVRPNAQGPSVTQQS